MTEIPHGQPAQVHRVLLVDDQRIIGESIRRTLLDHEDIVYRHLVDPRKAVAVAEEFGPTLILQDLVMPEVDGLDLVDAYRKSERLVHVPLVVLSVKEEPDVKAEAFRRGANDYLVKLPSTVELIARIRYHSTSYLNACQRREAFEALQASEEQIREQRDVLARQAQELERKNRFIRRTFGRYLSDDIVKSILETPEGLKLGGELRTVTVMMSDLRGFTVVAERLSPEKLLHLLNGYLADMVEVITSYRGTIDEFLGDAILAVFGAPHGAPDDAERAVACAIAMQLRMKEVNQRNASEGLPLLEMGVALHTGETVVGNIGSQTRAKYGVVGRNVNVVSRLESNTIGGQVLISGATLEAVGPVAEIGVPLEVRAKGFAQPIQAFDLRGIGGRHGLWLPIADMQLELVRPPLVIRYQSVKGKTVEEKSRLARIVRASLLGADLQDTRGLEHLENLRIRILKEDGTELEDDIYAKVVDIRQDGVSVRFTSLAPEAMAFLEGHVVGKSSTDP